MQVITNAVDRAAGEAMVTAVKAKTDRECEMVSMENRASSKAFYEVLYTLTTGEAKAIVRNVDDEDGFMAWRMLQKQYDRRTLARTLKRYKDLMSPKQVGHVSEVMAAVASWEA